MCGSVSPIPEHNVIGCRGVIVGKGKRLEAEGKILYIK